MMLQDFTLAAILFAIVLVFLAEERQESADHDRSALIGSSVASLNDAVEGYVKAHYGSLELCLGSPTMAKGAGAGTPPVYPAAPMSPWVALPLYYVADPANRLLYLNALGLSDESHRCAAGPFVDVPTGYTGARPGVPASLQETGFLPSFLARPEPVDFTSGAAEPQRWLRKRLDFRVAVRLVDVGPANDSVPVPAVQAVVVGRTLAGDALPVHVVREAAYLSGSAASGYLSGTSEVASLPPRAAVGVGGGWSLSLCMAAGTPAAPAAGVRVPPACTAGYRDPTEAGLYQRSGDASGPLWRAFFPGAVDRAEYASGSAYPGTSEPKARLVSFVSSARARILDAVLYRKDIGVPGTAQMERDLDGGGFAVVQLAAITGVSTDEDPEIEHGVQIVGPPPGAHCSDDPSTPGDDCAFTNQPTRVHGDLHVTGNLLVGGVYPKDFKPVLIAPAEAAAPREAHIGRVHVATGETESGERRRPDGPDPHGSLFVEGRGYVEEDVRVGSSLGVGHRFGTPDAAGNPPVPYDTPSDILGPFAGLYGGDATSPGIEPRGHLHVRGEIYVESDARFARSLGLGHVRTAVGYTAAERDDILGPEPERFETASERVETPGVFADGAARRGFVHIRGETYVEEDVRIYRGLGLGHVRVAIGDTAAARDDILGPVLAPLPPKAAAPGADLDGDGDSDPLRDGSGRGGTLHVRGETYLEEDVRALRNFGVGHVRIAIGDAPAHRDEVLGGTLPTLSAKTAAPSATAMRTGADRGGNVHVRGETYLEEDVRALRNFGVGHVRIASGDAAANRDEVLGGSVPVLTAKTAAPSATAMRTGADRGGNVHVRGETYLEEDVRALRNFGVGHVRIASGDAAADRDEVLGGSVPVLTAKTAAPSATAMRTGADRGGNVHVRGETYLEEDVRALRDLGVGHVRLASGDAAADRDEILGASRATLAAKTAAPGTAMRTGAHRSGQVHVRGESYLEENVRVLRDFGLGHVRRSSGDAATARDEILGGRLTALAAKTAVPAAASMRTGTSRTGHLHVRGETYGERDVRFVRNFGLGHVRTTAGTTATVGIRDDILGREDGDLSAPTLAVDPVVAVSRGTDRLGHLHVRGEAYTEESVRVLRDLGVGHVRIASGDAAADRDEILGASRDALAAKTAVPGTAMRTGAHRSGQVHVRGESYLEEDVRVYRDFGVGLVRFSSGDAANREDILGGAVPALPAKNAVDPAVALRGTGGAGGHLHVAQEAYVEEDLRVRKALGVGHERTGRGDFPLDPADPPPREDILGTAWSAVPVGDIGDVDIQGELYVRKDARIASNAGVGLERTAIGTVAAQREDILANASARYSVLGSPSADHEKGHLHVEDSMFAKEELRVGGGIGVGHRVTDSIPARGSGGSGVPVLDLANAASAGARVFIHDPANLWWHQDPESRNSRSGATWRGNLAGSLPAYSMTDVDHGDRRSSPGGVLGPDAWASYFAVPAGECSYTVVPAGVARNRHPTFTYTISIESDPSGDATWTGAEVSFDVPSPLLGWELGGPGSSAGADVAVRPGGITSDTRYYALRGCNLRTAGAGTYATP